MCHSVRGREGEINQFTLSGHTHTRTHTQEQVARMVEAQDARLSQVEAEAAEKGREARRLQAELQAKLDAAKDTCEGVCTRMQVVRA